MREFEREGEEGAVLLPVEIARTLSVAWREGYSSIECEQQSQTRGKASLAKLILILILLSFYLQALFAHHVWNASLILADRISTSSISGLEMDASEGEDDEESRGTMSVCELGCGAGIPGLIAARSPNVKRVSSSLV